MNEVGFKLVNVSTEEFSLKESLYHQNQDEVSLGFSIRFGADPDAMIVGAFVEATFSKSQGPFLTAEVGCHFELSPDSWKKVFDSEAKVITLPKAIGEHFCVITTGTLRGVLHAKTDYTHFKQYIFPTINLRQHFKKHIVIDLNDGKTP